GVKPSFWNAEDPDENRNQSYHGRRGDHAGLAASVGPLGTICCSEPSGSMGKILAARWRWGWNARWRPVGAHEALSLSPGPVVRRRTFEPSGAMIQISCAPCREV